MMGDVRLDYRGKIDDASRVEAARNRSWSLRFSSS
jgi:hypothetical protein